MKSLFFVLIMTICLGKAHAEGNEPLLTCEGPVAGAAYVAVVPQADGTSALSLGNRASSARTKTFKEAWAFQREGAFWFVGRSENGEHALVYWDKSSGQSALDLKFDFSSSGEFFLQGMRSGTPPPSDFSSNSVDLHQTATYNCHQ